MHLTGKGLGQMQVEGAVAGGQRGVLEREQDRNHGTGICEMLGSPKGHDFCPRARGLIMIEDI